MIEALLALVPGARRTRGVLERRLALRHRDESGIVVGFRGPGASQQGVSVDREWTAVFLSVDGEYVRPQDAHSYASNPVWVECTPGEHLLTVSSAIGQRRELLSQRVVVECTPTIVALWPETTGLLGRTSARATTYRHDRRGS